ncbi:hypothetical protein TGRUB_262500 [Toxoplasma gondii RUB]|uniref:Uncharacterized protein n=1 Tax=Toxoplasma gondii RUB TaxID=935652 RepID=A0A086M9B0_TOXGO|nr:hypothetical protein TGRUB_262500 [Toxoplasma gondii RUB]
MHSFFPRERRSSLLGLRLGLTGYRENVERDPREETIERFREYEMPCVVHWWVRVSFSFFDFRLHASDACMDFLESALSHGVSCGVPGHNCVSSRAKMRRRLSTGEEGMHLVCLALRHSGEQKLRMRPWSESLNIWTFSSLRGRTRESHACIN